MLRELIRTYLLESGWRNDPSDAVTGANRDAYWYHETLGVRDFETAVIWQMTQEGGYGERVAGWRNVSVPVPVEQTYFIRDDVTA